MTFSIPYRSLREAARQDRGIVVYGDGQVIVCDWAADCPRGGLPVLSWRRGLRPSMDDVDYGAVLEMYKEAVDDIRAVLPNPLDWGKVYDPNGELSRLLSGDGPKNCMAHVVRCYGLTAIVLAPPVWRYGGRVSRRLFLRSRQVVFVLRRVTGGYKRQGYFVYPKRRCR